MWKYSLHLHPRKPQKKYLHSIALLYESIGISFDLVFIYLLFTSDFQQIQIFFCE